MTHYRAAIWAQWDKQEARRIEAAYYITLNNTYLLVERGSLRLSISVANDLRTLVPLAYPDCPRMQEYWQTELEKLPRWFSV